MERNAEEIKKFVKKRYGGLARQKGQSCCSSQSSSCCGPKVADSQLKSHAGRLYTDEELGNLPADVTDISLGCGNPTAIAELNEGEVVLDLGSGGGIDCFLAAQKVGSKGGVIGLDMTPEMIQLARQNAQKIGATNVEFRLGEMEHMPVRDSSVDVIISNCVINLSPDKDAVFREAYRVLKLGGRLCVSDIMLLGELPQEFKESLEQWTGCIAGALNEKTYLDKIRAAGFINITMEKNKLPFSVENEAVPSSDQDMYHLYLELEEKVASVRVKAFKPAQA